MNRHRIIKVSAFAVLLLMGGFLTSCENDKKPQVELTENQKLMDLASQGDVKSQYLLAERLRLGDGLDVNLKDAFTWYSKAADQGDFRSQMMLAKCYRLGLGVTKDVPKSLMMEKSFFKQLVERTKDNDSPDDLSRIGWCYMAGRGVLRDPAQAFKWFERAASKGDPYAQYQLGRMYYEGDVTNKNIEKAVELFEKSANQGDSEAQYVIGNCYFRGENKEQDMEKAFEWFERSSKQGFADSKRMLAYCYFNGFGVSQSHSKGLKLYESLARDGDIESMEALLDANLELDNHKKAREWVLFIRDYCPDKAVNGDPLAQYLLARVTPNSEAGGRVKWYTKASEQGHREAQFELAQLYYEGELVLKDNNRALGLYELAANQGHIEAQFWLGQYYATPYRAEFNIPSHRLVSKQLKDPKFVDAFEWYYKAANNGHGDSQYQVGRFYYYGCGVDKDLMKCKEWIRKAHTQGHRGASTFWKTHRLWE